VALGPGRTERGVSAMVRVRNEEEFLYPAVKSIADLVEEVVIIDNRSSDGTADIIAKLREEYPHKVVAAEYPFEIRKVGAESIALAATRRGRRSPHLSANYYNWCLRRCSRPYILKWDGDMIATAAFARGLEAWRRSAASLLILRGANVHPDRRHLLAARVTDRETLTAGLDAPGMPAWVTSLTYDYAEPRLFPARFARYQPGAGWTQTLESPFLRRGLRSHACHTLDEPCYLHLKFCKASPLATYSADLARVIDGNLAVGPPLEPEWHTLLERWHLV
jgi:glycosyltransferase involved in cell wall biosynthesis